MRFRSLVALFAALVLFVGACGGDDDESADDGGDTTEESQDNADTGDAGDTADDAGDTGDEGDQGDDGDDSAGLDIPEGADLGECGFLVDFAESMGGNPMSMFAGDGMQSMAEGLASAADKAPSEISEDLHVMADGFGEVAEAMDGLELDFSDPQNMDPEVMEKMTTAMESMNTAEFQEASENVTAWMQDACPDLAGVSGTP